MWYYFSHEGYFKELSMPSSEKTTVAEPLIHILTLSDADNEPLISRMLSQNPENNAQWIIEHNGIEQKTFESLLGFAQLKNLTISLKYLGRDTAKKVANDAYNNQLNELPKTAFSTFTLATEGQSYILTPNPDVPLVFAEDNDFFTDFKRLLSDFRLDKPLYIQLNNSNSPNLDDTALFQFLLEKKLRCHLIFNNRDLQETPEIHALNQKLKNYHWVMVRDRHVSEQETSNVLSLFEKPIAFPKVRRSKLMTQHANKKIVVRSQQQYQYQKQQNVEQTTERAMQRQQQSEQQRQSQTQQFQNRQQLIQRQQARQKNVQQVGQQVNVASMGNLIHRGNLNSLVTHDWDLEKVTRVWTNLVGKYVDYVDNENNKITHVSEATMRLIMEHSEEFNGGIHFDDLPNGFGFEVVNHEGKSISLLYYDAILKKTDNKREDSLLAAQLKPAKPAIDDFGDVGQFYPFTQKNRPSYASFCSTNQNNFTCLCS